ncbi:hypothetical protein Aglo03_35250 [Actinokineospora globicatena]|uniref:Uncharacterized protein n=2 Tax=Actinokineospora globicatena TaxID=103729 RepID=A0A9W6QQD9_9PSEU|nr:hypothetical protein Aglo03_35250 [Actinokineospora globicatena]
MIHLVLDGGHFGSKEERDAVHALEDELEKALDLAGAGEVDGDTFGGGEVVVYIYGPDADVMYATVGPVLQRQSQFSGHVILLYGDHVEGVPERRVELEAGSGSRII